MVDPKGRPIPVDNISPKDKLVDQAVRKIICYAGELSDQIGRFKGHTFDDIGALMDVLREEYGAPVGGKKGNVTFTSFDGLLKVAVQVQDHIAFGPELQIAKELIDQCINDWSADASDKIRALVNHAFDVDRPGNVNREALFALRKIEIDDDRWRKAQQAITDSIRVEGSKSYCRFYHRADIDAPWQAIKVDLAAA
nr:DUF3164 family protein [Kordiimonas marina]